MNPGLVNDVTLVISSEVNLRFLMRINGIKSSILIYAHDKVRVKCPADAVFELEKQDF